MIEILDKKEATKRINRLASEKTPFIFIIDFEMDKCQVYPLSNIPKEIKYNIRGNGNLEEVLISENYASLEFEAVSFETYSKGFKYVQDEINYGNSFLLNLTYPSKVKNKVNLNSLFHQAYAPYKLLIEKKLLVFSPECFVKIANGTISSFPMKGTINASVPNAKSQILEDQKEKAEHYTIVDLIRNDLSIVANKVSVENFRYIDSIHSKKGDLLQVSSKIVGQLQSNYLEKMGDIIFALLPAGSISGAPKKKTLEIIKAAENYERAYYTGVFGVFDGEALDSSVMIRCIQNIGDDLFYFSGGGITHKSKLKEEYQELISKIYVPTFRNDTN